MVSKDGKRVYAVTEHSGSRSNTYLRARGLTSYATDPSAQYLDVYDATEDGLRYVHSASVIPPGKRHQRIYWLCWG